MTQNAGKLYLELRQYSGGLIYHCRVKVCSEGNQASAAHNLRARAAVVRVLRGRRQGETHPEQHQDPMEDGASRSTDSANRSAIEDAPSSSSDSPEMATVRRLVVETVAVIVVAADHRREARGRDRRCQARTSVSVLNMGGSGKGKEGGSRNKSFVCKISVCSCTTTKEASILMGSLSSGRSVI